MRTAGGRLAIPGRPAPPVKPRKDPREGELQPAPQKATPAGVSPLVPRGLSII